ncbi:hypothetical protein LIER_09801 [Lithospermum erythrorhizon]|uniref:Myb-like domain-containing protein n=1 Tax=Lithospermum erythrorhizon TaxID=34254 RepID=A0AAV3PH64_LITER
MSNLSESIIQNHGYNANSTRSLQYHQGSCVEWTPDEQAILEEGLIKYASEPVINSYAKIALLLENKTIRDVALRCTWMRKKENTKKRKEDLGLTGRNKEINVTMENVLDPTVMPPYITVSQGFAQCIPRLTTNKTDVGISYNGVAGPVRHLLQQNAQTFDQISMNIATNQLHENIGLLFQSRENIYKILKSLDDMPAMKQMHPLPIKVDEELANTVLPPSSLR